MNTRRIITSVIITIVLIMTVGIGYSKETVTNTRILDVDEGRFVCTTEADEIFIPVYTAGYILWAQRLNSETNLMSCNVETGEVVQINEEPIRYIYDIYPSITVAFSNGWVSYMSNSSVNNGVLWLAPVDGSQSPKLVSSSNCTAVSYPEFYGDRLYFWQKMGGEETSGLYTYRMSDDAIKLVYALDHSMIYKFDIDECYIAIYRDSHCVTIITHEGELVREIDFEEDESVESAMVFDLSGGQLMVGRSIISSDKDNTKEDLYRKDNFYSLYDIANDEFIDLNDKRNLGTLSNCIRISPDVFAFIKLYPIEDLYKETPPGIWSINIVDPESHDIQSYPYNGPQSLEKDPRVIEHSSIWDDLVLYPTGDNPDEWYLDLYDTKNRTAYRVTEKPNEYLYPTINDWHITYFIKGMDVGKYNLLMHSVEGNPLANEDKVDRDREWVVGEKIVCLESIEIFENWTYDEPSIMSASGYVVWKEKLDDIIFFRSYSFTDGEKYELMQTSTDRLYSGSNQIQWMLDSGHLAVMKEDEETRGWRVFIVALDGSESTMIGDGKSIDDHLLDMRDGKVYIFQEYRNSKLSCIQEYDIENGVTESLFKRELLPRTFYRVGERFLINSVKRVESLDRSTDILVVDRQDNLQRRLNGVPSYPLSWPYYTMNIVTDKYVFFLQIKSYLDYSAPLDYWIERRTVCYDLEMDSVLYLPYSEFVYCNGQRNCDTIIALNFYRGFQYACSALNLKTRAFSKLNNIPIGFFNRYNTSLKSINDDMLAVGTPVYKSDDNFREKPTYSIYLIDIKTNKMYSVAEELEYCSSILLVDDRIVYIEPSEIDGYNIVTHTITEKIPVKEE